MFASYSNKWRQLKSPVAPQGEDAADHAVRELCHRASCLLRVFMWMAWAMACVIFGEIVAELLIKAKLFNSLLLCQLINYIVTLGLMLGVPYLWHKLRHHPAKFWAEVGLGGLPRSSDAALTAKMILPYYAMIILAGIALQLVAPNLVNEKQHIVTDNSPLGLASMINSNEMLVILALYLIVAVMAPIAEEMIFRGFLYTKLRRVVGVANAMLWVSLVFALAHGQVAAGMVTFILSMCNCYMREKTGRIYPGIFLHMMCNTIALTLQIALLH